MCVFVCMHVRSGVDASVHESIRAFFVCCNVRAGTCSPRAVGVRCVVPVVAAAAVVVAVVRLHV